MGGSSGDAGRACHEIGPTVYHTYDPVKPNKKVQGEETFNIEEAEVTFAFEIGHFYLKKKQQGEVTDFRKLDTKEQNKFREVRKKEMNMLLEAGAVKVLTPKETA